MPGTSRYYSERLQESRFQVSQEELREYLPLPRVLASLFEVAERLYGVRLAGTQRRAGLASGRALLRGANAAGAPLASFYLDAYARTGKRSGAWMDDCVGRMQLGGELTLPVAYLVCNSLPPQDGRPALLTHDDVVTLFHEFGHGLHHMLTRIGYPSIAGINGVPWDAVELPSQFMENYAWLHEVLARIGAHAATGEPIPEAKLRQLIATRSFQAGLHTLRQVEFALFDMRIHAEYDPARGSRVCPSCWPKCAPKWRSRAFRSGIAIPTASRTSSPAAMRRVTTATSGPRCWRPMPSPRSVGQAPSIAPPQRASSTASWRAAAAATRSSPSSNSAAASPRSRPLLELHGIAQPKAA